MIEYINKVLADISFLNFNIPPLQIIDIVDMLIVAFIIYQLLMWIRETRTWSLFKGIIVISMVFAIAYFLKLYTLQWLISIAFNIGLIAVIVLFQPELRKALESLGKRKINIGISHDVVQISENTVNEIVKAVGQMAEVRTGALILVENDVPLGDHERTGIPIDAVVSSQLLINIFEDKTPLHDGAVIIRNNRIAAATCILPLTQDEIGRQYGTRHRAAVGASEVCDATVIVVSEETGKIAVAKRGKLHRERTLAQVREELFINPPEADGEAGIIEGLLNWLSSLRGKKS